MTVSVKVVVVDDHPIFRSGLVQLLELDERYLIAAEGNTGSEAVVLAAQHKPDLLLLDLAMPEGGLDVITAVLQESAQTRVVALTASDAVEDIETALDRGVSGYILKGTSGAEMLDALENIVSGQTFISSRAMSRMIMASRTRSPSAQGPLYLLSARERAVLEMISQGLSNREISLQLHVEEKTIKFHVTNIFSKLGVRNRVEAAILFHNIDAQ